ncbi:galactose oxidase-like domain-containing protein [Candidatus Nitrososphaera sp. FF02]|uniref:galactose oxidase-like domain-containing protein n=1 Tax=Candidatus Nitrososphaera sp. FF02 TaxID=3398226 RepID=UPI0039EC3640
MTERMSRREFLKIMGAASIGLALGGLGFSTLKTDKAANRASAQTYGSWQLGGTTHATAVHVALLHNGKVLYVAGSGFYEPNELGPFEWGKYDTTLDSSEPQPNLTEDPFCASQSVLPNGNILVVGGTLDYNNRAANGKWHGLNAAWIYEVDSNNFRRIASMSHGRWYPTQVQLADGRVLVVGGWDEYGVVNKLTEIFDPATETWSVLYDPNSTATYCVGEGEDPLVVPGAGQPCYGPGVSPNVLLYPRMHLMPNGLVAVCGQSKTLRTFNPATGVWKFAGNMLFGATRGYGTSVLLPLQNTTSELGSILIFGGTANEDAFATTSAEILTPSGTALQSRWIAASQFGRKHPIPVIMPDGNILVIGGTTFQNSGATKIMEAELFDPVAETWTTLPAMTVPRQYHSSAILLPDGRVWTGGTTYSKASRELRVEYFVPSWFSATRPTISGDPVVGAYGGTITIPTPDGLDIDAVSLVALSTETHAYNTDQRLVWLQIQSKTATEVIVSAPINANLAPPSYYHIFILKQGVPSVSKMVKVPGFTPPPDTDLPTVSITTPALDEIMAGPAPALAVNVAGTAADVGSGLQVVEVSVDGGAFAAATGTDSWSFVTAPLVEGSHTVSARAKDNANNVSAISTTNFTVDLALGGTFVNIYSVAGTNSYGTMASTGSSGDTTGIGEKITSSSSLIGTAVKRVTVVLKKSGNTTGTVYVRIRNAGGAVAKEISTIDAAALTASDQTFTVTASSAHILQANDVLLVEWAGTGSSADVVSVKRTAVDAFNGTSTYNVARKASGTYTNSTTRDMAGDWYYESSTPADTTVPTIGIVSPVPDEILTGAAPGFPVTVTGTAADVGSGLQLVEVSVDSGAFAAATGTDSWSYATPVLTAGPHIIAARAKDNAGNFSDVASVNITVEVTTSGNFVSIYSVAGTNSYSTMASTGSSGDVTGIGETLTPSSSLIGSPIKRVAVVLKKTGSPTGVMNVRIRNSGGTIVKEIGTIDSSLLTASDQTFTVTATSAYILQANDKVLVEWDGTGSGTDIVHVKRHGTDTFDGTNTYIVARKASGSYTSTTTRDMAGDWYYET